MKKVFTIILILFFGVFGALRHVEAYNCTPDNFTCTEWSPTPCSYNDHQTRQCWKTTNCLGDLPNSRPCTVPDENSLPKITSFSATTIKEDGILEIFGENFNYAEGFQRMRFGVTPAIFSHPPRDYSPNYSTAELISRTNNKIVLKIDKYTTPGNSTACLDYFFGGSISDCYSPHFYVKGDCMSNVENEWICSQFGSCSANGERTRVCYENPGCWEITTPAPPITEKCTPSCTQGNWTCSDWSDCFSSNQQTRNCQKNLNCQGGVASPNTTQSCTYTPTCTSSDWSCGSWSSCSSNGTMTRDCNKNSNCEGGESPPITNKSCTYVPPCDADTWTCSVWGSCSPSGIQNRNCTKTSDCPNVQTGAPATEQFCEAPNKPQQVVPNETKEKVTQGTIIEAIIKSFTSNNDTNSNVIISTTSHIKQKTILQSQDGQTQKESIVIIESNNNNEGGLKQNISSTTSKEETSKPTPVRRFFLWIFLKIKFW